VGSEVPGAIREWWREVRMVRGSIAVLAFVGCNVENGFHAPHATDVFYQVPNDDVDILFVVDESGSMHDEQVALANGFDSFLSELENSATNYQIGLVSTSQDAPDSGRLVGNPPFLTPADDTRALFEERVLLGVAGSDKEKGLVAAVNALTQNPGFVRFGASLVVVFVTDEDDCSDDGELDGKAAISCYQQREHLVPVSEMVERIRGLKPGGEVVRFGGILGPLDWSCEGAYPGTRYARAIVEAGGSVGKICDADWTPVLSALGVVAVGILEQFELAQAADAETIEVYVDEELVPEDPENGWTYDWQTTMVTFHGDAIPPRDSTIRVEYEVTFDPSG
jgi:hypothetical protein